MATMNLTLAEGLLIPPLNRCRVVAGSRGLHRAVTSVNIMDAPDTVPWLKPGELLLTTGYVFKDDPNAQVRLIGELSERGCVGLALKVRRFLPAVPPVMLREADFRNLPLIEIPGDLALSDVMLPLLGEILIRQQQRSEHARRTAFFSSLFRGELHGRDAILAQGRSFGLLPGCEYICLCAALAPAREGGHPPAAKAGLLRAIAEASQEAGANLLAAELEDAAILLQARNRQEVAQLPALARRLATRVVDQATRHLPNHAAVVGIGTPRADVLGIRASYREAQEAVHLGHRVAPAAAGAVYEFQALEPYALLQHLPEETLSRYLDRSLQVLARYDQETGADLVRTLEVYLACGGSPSETARHLYVHRNTVKFRVTRIEELLGVDLNEGETVFRLQLALRIAHLLRGPSQAPSSATRLPS